jgi:hypothetical protein
MFTKKHPDCTVENVAGRFSNDEIEPSVGIDIHDNDFSNETDVSNSRELCHSKSFHGPYDLDDYATLVLECYDPDASYVCTSKTNELGHVTNSKKSTHKKDPPIPQTSHRPGSSSGLMSLRQSDMEGQSTAIEGHEKVNYVKDDPPATIYSQVDQLASQPFARRHSSDDVSTGSNQNCNFLMDTSVATQSKLIAEKQSIQSFDAANVEVSCDGLSRMKTDRKNYKPDALDIAKQKGIMRHPIILPNGEEINAKNINRSYAVEYETNVADAPDVANHKAIVRHRITLPNGEVIDAKNINRLCGVDHGTNDDPPIHRLVDTDISPSQASSFVGCLQDADCRNIDMDSSNPSNIIGDRQNDVFNVVAEPVRSVLLVKAEPMPPPQQPKTLTFRVLVALGIVIFGAALVVGGYCGSGNCAQSKTDNNSSRPTDAPTTMPPVFVDTTEITAYINNITLSGGVIDADESSPENKALEWIVNNVNITSLENGTEQLCVRQQYSLATLFFQKDFSLKLWNNDTGWLNDTSECNWYGIVCNTTEAGSEVTQIDLSRNGEGNNVGGTMPADLGLLMLLTSFNASFNPLYGSLPESIGNWIELQYFDLYSVNNIYGTLPNSTGQWTALKSFTISNNLDGVFDNENQGFSGRLPESIGQWTALTSLYLELTSINGTLPESIGHWTALKYFSICDFTYSYPSDDILGSLPESIGQWHALTSFTLCANSISGTLPESIGQWTALTSFSLDTLSEPCVLPESIGNWTALESFVLYANSITGKIPESIGQWHALTSFSLHAMPLSTTATLPESIGHWTALTSFDVLGSALPGTFPRFIGDWTVLTYFDVSESALTGTLPVFIGDWTALTHFGAANSALNGTIPSSVGNWTALANFDVSSNSALTGTLPSSVGNWTALMYFDVSYNALNGTVPNSIEDWSQIGFADFSNNQFSGTIPNGICNATNIDVLRADCPTKVVCFCCCNCFSNGTCNY